MNPSEVSLPIEERHADALGQGTRPLGRVLVVEDAEVVRMLTVEVLEELGYEALEAGDATQALALLEHESVDLLLTDVGLPGMNGQELATRACTLHPSLRVLFATGYAESIRPDPARAALQDVIAKPFGIEELRGKVSALLAR